MNEVTVLLTLASVHFIALISPGPDFALVVQNATRYGRQTGLYIALGLSVSILLHAIFSLTGVSFIIQKQPLLFLLLQLAGGSYLFYLGFGALKSVFTIAKAPNEVSVEPSLLLSSRKQAFAKGFATNLLNPKALVFFVSLMSSLVPASMSSSGKGIALVLLFGLSLFWFSFLAWVLSGNKLQKKLTAISHYIDGLCGFVFTILGGTILFQSIEQLLSHL